MLIVEPGLALAAMTAERSVIWPFPVPPEITPVPVLTLTPVPVTGRSLMLVGVNVAAWVEEAIPRSMNAQTKAVFFEIIKEWRWEWFDLIFLIQLRLCRPIKGRPVFCSKKFCRCKKLEREPYAPAPSKSITLPATFANISWLSIAPRNPSRLPTGDEVTARIAPAMDSGMMLR